MIFHDGKVVLHPGDCMRVLETLPDNSLDATVTDPPYHLTSIVKRFSKNGYSKSNLEQPENKDLTVVNAGAFRRLAKGFMGKVWDGGDLAFTPEMWSKVFRVLKPGAHLVAFGGTRTYHRLATAIEEAGFEIRDCLQYLYGTGFPKSHSMDRALGDDRCKCESVTSRQKSQCDVRSLSDGDVSASASAESGDGQILFARVQEQSLSPKDAKLPSDVRRRQPGMEGRRDVQETARQLCAGEVRPLPVGPALDGEGRRLHHGASAGDGEDDPARIEADGMRSSSRSPAAQQHSAELGALAGQSESQDGGAWPCCERCGKPIVPHGMGTALKPACELIVLARKPLSEATVLANVLRWGTGAINVDACRVEAERGYDGGIKGGAQTGTHTLGRFPANLIHDGSPEVLAGFPDNAGGGSATPRGARRDGSGWDRPCNDTHDATKQAYDGQGSAARFFYTAKADAEDRIGSKHPTVKPVDLMQWLVRLITPKGGTVLDPFAGTGTTGAAAFIEGMRAILIEREAEYQADIARRMELLLSGPVVRGSRLAAQPLDNLPLFPIGQELC